MTTKAIRYWLMRRPRPQIVSVLVGNERSDLAVENPVSWARLAESVAAYDADRIEALNANRGVIRACRPSELDDAPDADAGDEETPPEPTVPAAVVTDPETARFALVANLLADAYKHSNTVAFARLVDVLDRVAAREDSNAAELASMRQQLNELAQDRLDEAEEARERAQQEGGVLGEIASAFAGGQTMGSGGGNGTPPAPNGKAH